MWSNPCSSRDTYRVSKATSRWLLKISKVQAPWPRFASAQFSTQCGNGSWCLGRTSWVPFCLHCFLSWHWAPLKRTKLKQLIFFLYRFMLRSLWVHEPRWIGEWQWCGLGCDMHQHIWFQVYFKEYFDLNAFLVVCSQKASLCQCKCGKFVVRAKFE